MGKEWIKLKEIGQLYLEKILVAFDVPILFVCTDYEKRRYLCLNIDNETGETVIAEVSNKQLIQMLKNETPMEVLFRDSINEKIFIATYDDAKGEVISNSVYSRDISENMLPKKNEFFELSNSMITDYIGFLSTVEGLNMSRIKVV